MNPRSSGSRCASCQSKSRSSSLSHVRSARPCIACYGTGHGPGSVSLRNRTVSDMLASVEKQEGFAQKALYIACIAKRHICIVAFSPDSGCEVLEDCSVVATSSITMMHYRRAETVTVSRIVPQVPQNVILGHWPVLFDIRSRQRSWYPALQLHA